jgi:hypothetical protein
MIYIDLWPSKTLVMFYTLENQGVRNNKDSLVSVVFGVSPLKQSSGTQLYRMIIQLYKLYALYPKGNRPWGFTYQNFRV